MSCPACGGELDRWLSAPGSEPSDAGSYEIARCRACGSATTLGPPPSADAYSSGIYGGAPRRLGRTTDALQGAAVRLPVRLLERAGARPGATILDAGAGRGRLVAALRQRGYAADGIDQAPRSDLVRSGNLLEHEARNLDGVVLWHVIEHVPELRKTLERVRGWLRPGGVVVVGAPNLASLQARIAGPRWFHLDLPRHRTHLTPKGLRACMDAAGIEAQRTRHLVPEHNFHGMWLALLTRLGMTPGFPFHLVKRNVKLRPRDLALLAVAGPPLLLVAVPLELAAAAIRRGGTIAMVGRRPESAVVTVR